MLGMIAILDPTPTQFTCFIDESINWHDDDVILTILNPNNNQHVGRGGLGMLAIVDPDQNQS